MKPEPSPNPQRKAVIYTRVSTDRQTREGDGLRSQATACEEFAAHNDYTVIRTFSDVMSGKHAARSGMEDMLAYLRAHPGDNWVVLIDDISRLARDLMSYLTLRNEIAAAGGELKSPKMTFSDDPAAQLPERMMAIIVEHERITNARRASERMRARLQNGYWCFPVPSPAYRFINDPAQGGKVMIRQEPAARVLAETLELFASGQLSSQAEVMRHLNAQPGYPKGKSGTISKQRIRPLLSNPLNAGYIQYDPWGIKLTKARHEPLISLETFKKIQDRLKGRPVFPVRKSINEDFPLRGFVLCDDCGQPYRGAFSKSRNGALHGYYVCQTKSCSSYGKSARKADVEDQFEALLASLAPRPELMRIAADMFKTLWANHSAAHHERMDTAQKGLKALETRLQGVIERAIHATRPSLINAYEGEIERLEHQRSVEEERLARMEREGALKTPDFEKAYRTAMEFLANPLKLWRSQRIEDRRAAVKLTFASQLRYKRNDGYRTADIALPFRVLGDLTQPGSSMVRTAGLEPARPFGRQILSLLRLPIPPCPHMSLRLPPNR